MDSGPSDHWQRMETLFAATAELPPAERAAVLDACAGDPLLREELDRLLAAHDRADGFLDQLDTKRAAALVHPIDDEVRAGEMIGGYRVVRQLGRGGMGLVLLAHDPRLDRFVALKLLPALLSTADRANQRLTQEAQAASALDHPHIATIHEIGEAQDGRRFIAMAFYDGQTLRQMIARGPLPVAEALGIAAQIADGLRAAHRLGIVHRDIKPENVIITSEGIAKIVDFGVAQVAGRDTGGGAHTVGTAAYMSPEQTRGEPVDARADLWSLGAMLYEMLTGERPFRADAEHALLDTIRNDEPEPMRTRRTDVHRDIAGFVERCLEKDAARRFQNADELLSHLRALTAASRSRSYVTRRSALATFATLIFVAAGFVVTNVTNQRAAAPADASSIAVLPFVNLGPDSSDDYLSDGIAEEVLSALGRVPGLHVTARTSSFAFRRPGQNASTIGRALGVRHLLEGSVQRAGNRLRISVRLIDAATGYQLWTESYDREFGDLFTVHDEISRAIAGALSLRLVARSDAAARRRPPGSAEAHELYLRGNHAWNKRTKPGMEQAVSLFEQATRIDTAYALAYAGLANAYTSLGTYGLLPGDLAFPRARAAAVRALELDATLAEPHTTLAALLVSERRFADAERVYQRAIALGPSHVSAYHWYGFMLGILDRTDEALRHVRRALELDPLSLSLYSTLGRLLVHAGQPEVAVEEVRRGIELDPTFPWTWHALGLAYIAQRQYDEAAAAFERVVERAPGHPGLRANIAAIRARGGQHAEARALLEQLGPTGALQPVDSATIPELDEYHVALLFAALGDNDSAFPWLERIPWNSEFMYKLRAEPLLEPLRDDPRYGRLLRTLGMLE